jgi:hypothetical protein
MIAGGGIRSCDPWIPNGTGVEKINKYNDVYGTRDDLYLHWSRGFGGPSAAGYSQGQQAAGKRQQPTENSRARERLMQTELRSRREAINCVPVQRALTMISFAARAPFLTVL